MNLSLDQGRPVLMATSREGYALASQEALWLLTEAVTSRDPKRGRVTSGTSWVFPRSPWLVVHPAVPLRIVTFHWLQANVLSALVPAVLGVDRA